MSLYGVRWTIDGVKAAFVRSRGVIPPAARSGEGCVLFLCGSILAQNGAVVNIHRPTQNGIYGEPGAMLQCRQKMGTSRAGSGPERKEERL